MDGRFRGMPPGQPQPATIKIYPNVGVSPNVVTFEADLPYVGPARGPFQYRWEFSASGSGLTAQYGNIVMGGPVCLQPLASGTLAARVQLWSVFGHEGEWNYSSLVTYTRPAALQIEVPTGSINGTNMVFTMNYTPTSGTFAVFLRGQLQPTGGSASYTASGNTITFNNNATYQGPQTGDPLYVIYSA